MASVGNGYTRTLTFQKKLGVVVHVFNPALGRQREVELFEFETRLWST